MTNYILEYWELIESGKIKVSRKVKKQYALLVDDIHNPKGNWIFDIDKANHPIEFIESFCTIPQTGKPFILELWQKAAIQAIFGFVDKYTGYRKYTYVMMLVGRKNGR